MLILKKIKFIESNLYWIVGFIDGEGCFSISFNKKESMPCGIEVRPSFSVSQKAHSLVALENIKEYFNCGNIRYDKKDGTYKYEIRSLTEIRREVIPFFSKYELITKKKYDFESFKKICSLIAEGQHLNPQGLKQIIQLAYSMNGSGKRKYKLEELLKFVDKLKI
jgi:hypothetical protein